MIQSQNRTHFRELGRFYLLTLHTPKVWHLVFFCVHRFLRFSFMALKALHMNIFTSISSAMSNDAWFNLPPLTLFERLRSQSFALVTRFGIFDSTTPMLPLLPLPFSFKSNESQSMRRFLPWGCIWFTSIVVPCITTHIFVVVVFLRSLFCISFKSNRR